MVHVSVHPEVAAEAEPPEAALPEAPEAEEEEEVVVVLVNVQPLDERRMTWMCRRVEAVEIDHVLEVVLVVVDVVVEHEPEHHRQTVMDVARERVLMDVNALRLRSKLE